MADKFLQLDNNKYVIQSSEIKVFPSSYRGTTDNTFINLESKLSTEYSLRHLSPSFTKNSYILSWEGDTLCCVIAGYYFEINVSKTNDIPVGYYKVAIKLSEVPLATGSTTDTTMILTSWKETINSNDQNTVADKQLDFKDTTQNEYYFSGLVFVNTIPSGCFGLDLSDDISIQNTHLVIDSSQVESKAQNVEIAGSLYNGTATGAIRGGNESNTTASGLYSSAIGDNVSAFGDYSHAEGNNNIAIGPCSHTEGHSTKVVNYYGHAEGHRAVAIEACAHAEGYNTIAGGQNSHAEGSAESIETPTRITLKLTGPANATTYTYSDASGTIPTTRAIIGFIYYTRGESSNYTSSLRYISSIDTANNTITLNSSLNDALDNTPCELVWGGVAYGNNSHIEGFGNVAAGGNAHAEGTLTIASGGRAHAEGYSTVASGSNSHAEGLNTVAGATNQHVFGQYNIKDATDTTTTQVEIVGWGSTSTPKNIRTLDRSGNEVLAGSLRVDGNITCSNGAISLNSTTAGNNQIKFRHTGSGISNYTILRAGSISATDYTVSLPGASGTLARIEELGNGTSSSTAGKVLRSSGSSPYTAEWSDILPYSKITTSGGSPTLQSTGIKLIVVSQANAPSSFDANTIYFITEN